MKKKCCYLCGSEPAGTGLNLVAGFDICDGCLHGDVKTRIRRLGITIDGKVSEAQDRWQAGYLHPDTQAAYLTEISGRCPSTARIGLIFGRETFGAKLEKIFKKEIQVGDRLFDDNILIRSEGDERQTRAFLEHEGVQSAIMDLVGATGRVVIEGGKISVSSPHDEFSAFNRYLVLTACLLVRLMHLR